MKKNIFLKILAVALVFTLVIGSSSLIAFADVDVYVNGNTIIREEDRPASTVKYEEGDVEWASVCTMPGEDDVSLTITGDVINEKLPEFKDPESGDPYPDENQPHEAVSAFVKEGTATLKTGDIVEKDENANQAVNIITSDGTADVEVGNVISVTNGLIVENGGGTINVTTKDIEAVETGANIVSDGPEQGKKTNVTTGNITSDSRGMDALNCGGTLNITAKDIKAAEEGVHIKTEGAETDSTVQITEEEFREMASEAIYVPYHVNTDDEYWTDIYETHYYIEKEIEKDEEGKPRHDENGNLIYKKNDDGTPVYKKDNAGNLYYMKETSKPSHGTASITVGNVTVKNSLEPTDDLPPTAGIESENYGFGQSVNLTVNGDVNVEAPGTAFGLWLHDTNTTVNGNVNVKSEAQAIAMISYIHAGHEADVKVTGNLTAESAEDEACGLVLDTGNPTDKYFIPEGEKAYDETDNTSTATITGDITATGKRAKGIFAGADLNDEVEATIKGNISADGEEESVGIDTDNKGGELRISVVGNVTSDEIGLRLNDSTGEKYTKYKGEHFDPDENDKDTGKTIEIDDAEFKVFVHTVGDKEVYYVQIEDEVLNQLVPNDDPDWTDEMKAKHCQDYLDQFRWTGEPEEYNHDPGTTQIEVIGDVTATETGLVVNLENDKSVMDVIVDGTLSGKTQSVLVSEETISDNLTLTVWEIKPNEDGNLVERIVDRDEDGEPTKTEADKNLEKKIQYIIRIDPNYTNNITTQGTKEYEGYNVANEGDTITLKLTIPEGQRVVSAYNGTDTKVKLSVDANGNYFLEVPRGGGVLLSLELEPIPEPDPEPETEKETKTETKTETVTETVTETTQTIIVATKIAALVAATDTVETTALKALIEEAVKNGDILSILPDDIKSKIPAGVSKLVEAITLKLENYKTGNASVKIKPGEKKYNENDKATVVIALPDGKGGYTWFVIEAEGQSDGTLKLNLPADIAAQLAGKTFVTMILE